MAGRGRPTKYTTEIAERICERLATGETLTAICRDEGMPSERTVRTWALDNADFFPLYARAREIGYLKMADELLEVADDGRNDFMLKKIGGDEVEVVNREAVERSKLRVDTRKWLLSKALPKIYGDKLDVNAKHEASDSFKALWQAIGKGGTSEPKP